METIREKRSILCFIISYVINNLASGVLYDTYVNYLQEVQVSIATSFWAFYGYATFISALLLLAVPKIGYKKLLLFCSLGTSFAFFGAIFLQYDWVLYAATLLALTGVQLHFIMLSPFIACYTEHLGLKKINWYTRTYYMGYIGYFIATYLGGAFVVKAFSVVSGITYSAAQEATRYITQLSNTMYADYMMGNEIVLFLFGCISLISLIPVLFIKEKKEDFMTHEFQEKISWKQKIREISDNVIKLRQL